MFDDWFPFAVCTLTGITLLTQAYRSCRASLEGIRKSTFRVNFLEPTPEMADAAAEKFPQLLEEHSPKEIFQEFSRDMQQCAETTAEQQKQHTDRLFSAFEQTLRFAFHRVLAAVGFLLMGSLHLVMRLSEAQGARFSVAASEGSFEVLFLLTVWLMFRFWRERPTATVVTTAFSLSFPAPDQVR